MCRLMGFVAQPPRSLREVISAREYQSFEEFSRGRHSDGWGVAWCEDSHVHMQKEAVPAFSSAQYQSLTDQPFDAALVHYRWATLSLEVDTGNTHPFRVDTTAFAHNGSISPPTSLDALIDPDYARDLEGSTDSERYFRIVLGESQHFGPRDGLRSAVVKIAESLHYSSLNALLLTPEYLYAACWYSDAPLPEDLPDDYYEMRYLIRDGAVTIASSGWDQSGWEVLGNGNMLSISRRTGEAEVLPISMARDSR
jgi:predicted glutamine amidotransferase